MIEWGGRYFVEKRLMFGTRSSPGIFDNLATCFLNCVVNLTPGFTRQFVEKHLDDVLGIGFPGVESPVHRFYENYVAEADKVGIKLDKSGNREKVQPPDTTVIALGVMFDTVKWEWRIKPERLAHIFNVLEKIEQGCDHEFHDMQSIVGKLIDIRVLVRGGKFNLLFFLLVICLDLRPFDLVKPSQHLREQARWWLRALAKSAGGSPILNPEPRIPSTAVEGWTDAAGGTTSHVGAGLGGLVPPYRYFYLPWSNWLYEGGKNSDGVVFSRKLTCLELLGALVMLVTCADVVVGGHLRCYMDNQGAVDVYRKGHSTTCVYTSTVAKVIFDVAEAIGATVTVEKIRRCSDRGSYTAKGILVN